MKDMEHSGRFTLRIPQAIAEKVQEAADLTGATAQQFMLQAALEKAERIIDRERNIYFSNADAAMLINLLDNPGAPTPALTRAFERLNQREANDGNQNSSLGDGT